MAKINSTDTLASELYEKYWEPEEKWVRDIYALRNWYVSNGSKTERFKKTGKTESTSCIADFIFLYMLVREYAPRKIVEVGTWYGASAASMALAAPDATVYTCDKHNVYVEHEKYSRQIQFYNSYSKDFLKQMVAVGIKTNFFFIDGRLRKDDDKKVMQLFKGMGKVCFAMHDWDLDKGKFNMKTMLKRMKDGVAYAPDVSKPLVINNEKINHRVALIMGEL